MNPAFFAEHGFAAVPLFEPEVVRAAQADISEQIDRVADALYMSSEHCLPGVPLTERIDRLFERERSYAKLIRSAICTDAQRGPRLSALADSPVLLEAAERFAGSKIGGTIQRVRASIKSFPEHRHAWHSDVAIDDGSACGSVCITAWIPLSDAGPGSGGLEVIPCRRTTPFPHQRTDGFEIPEEELTGMARVQPICPAGSALLLDRFTPHRTLPVTDDARFALVVWFKAA